MQQQQQLLLQVLSSLLLLHPTLKLLLLLPPRGAAATESAYAPSQRVEQRSRQCERLVPGAPPEVVREILEPVVVVVVFVLSLLW